MTDPGDAHEPVEGITLERYAEVAVALYGATTEEEVEARAVANGVPPGRIGAIAEVWNARMVGDAELVRRYSDLYQQAMQKAGIAAPPISFEQYAEILRRQAGGEPVAAVLADFGLTLQTFALVSQGWIEKMQSDPSLATRLGEILAAAQRSGGAPPPTGTPLL